MQAVDQVLVDGQYKDVESNEVEIPHLYGEQVHILNDVVLLTELATLCAQETVQPQVNHLVESIYRRLLGTVVAREFPRVRSVSPTRMALDHAQAVYRGPVLDRSTGAVTVNLARAGTLPSHIVYSELNSLLDPRAVRQDHISIARATNDKHQVSGSVVSGHKIGGKVDRAILLIPDPMGATGATVLEALKLYQGLGKPRKTIAIHCIVTPEYLANVTKNAPDLVVYAARLDRGLSSSEVLESVPGTFWDQEKGLNSKQYIVPGGGGFGEILNNAFV